MPWPYLKVGHVARIEDGPLTGLTGIVVKINRDLKLVLSVTLLQRSVAVEVDRHWLSVHPNEGPSAFKDATDSATPVDPAHLSGAQGFPKLIEAD